MHGTCSLLVDQGTGIYAVLMANSETDVKYRQIAADLRTRIEAGEFPAGTQIPGRDALKAQYGVAQHTVGSAIRELADLGLVEARQGLGTFVLKARADEPVPGNRQLAATVAELQAKVREMGEELGRVEANLVELYGREGHEYPWEDLQEKGARGEQRA